MRECAWGEDFVFDFDFAKLTLCKHRRGNKFRYDAFAFLLSLYFEGPLISHRKSFRIFRHKIGCLCQLERHFIYSFLTLCFSRPHWNTHAAMCQHFSCDKNHSIDDRKDEKWTPPVVWIWVMLKFNSLRNEMKKENRNILKWIDHKNSANGNVCAVNENQ